MKRILSLLLGLSLAVTLIGVGVNAALTTPNVTQQITVNGVGITVASSTPGIVILGDGTIKCPTVAINVTTTPSGTDAVGCTFTVSAVGIAPTSLSVSLQSDVNAPFAKYAINVSCSVGSPGGYTISTSYMNLATVAGSALPFTVETHVAWGTAAGGGAGTALTDSDIGKVINLTYGIAATA